MANVVMVIESWEMSLEKAEEAGVMKVVIVVSGWQIRQNHIGDTKVENLRNLKSCKSSQLVLDDKHHDNKDTQQGNSCTMILGMV